MGKIPGLLETGHVDAVHHAVTAGLAPAGQNLNQRLELLLDKTGICLPYLT